MKKIIGIILSITFHAVAAPLRLPQENQIIYIYAQENNPYYTSLTNALLDSNINFKRISFVDRQDDNLHILFDVNTLEKNNFPKNYIVYQTANLSKNNLTSEYIDILAQSIVVWDCSRENIAHYQQRIHNYHYFPANYEFTDPIILPCFLPKTTWKTYRDVVIYENKKNTDISSHLPTLLCYALLQKPTIVLELGVRGGESTVPLSKAAEYFNASLLGIDIEPDQHIYSQLKNATFFCMNDVDFPTLFLTSKKDKKIDIIFIDTSHLYEHTMQEITKFVPLLSDTGLLAFHDSNVTPLANSGYIRLNGTMDGAPGNTRGVIQAIKEYFAINFDEYKYFNTIFTAHGINWHIIHYPFCNGLTVIQKIKN